MEHWKLLKTRELSPDGIKSAEVRNYFWEHGVLIAAYNRDFIKYNMERIKMIGAPIAKYASENSHPFVANLTAAKCKGLPTYNWLCKGSKVLLTTSLSKAWGLTNKAKGTVRYIIYEGNNKPPSMPSFVIVEFENYSGPHYLGMKNCVPISPIKASWKHNNKDVWRRMIPLIPAYGRSIHSAQGQSIKTPTIINLGKTEFANGLTYVALSRATSWDNIAFYPHVPPFFPRFTSIFRQKMFKDRLAHDENERLADEEFDQVVLRENEMGDSASNDVLDDDPLPRQVD